MNKRRHVRFQVLLLFVLFRRRRRDTKDARKYASDKHADLSMSLKNFLKVKLYKRWPIYVTEKLLKGITIYTLTYACHWNYIHGDLYIYIYIISAKNFL